MPDTDEVKMGISANVVSFQVKESKSDRANEVNFKIKNTGEGELVLELRNSSSTSPDIFVDNRPVTMTEQKVKVPPGNTVLVRMIYTPKFDPDKPAGDKTRYSATFEHNDLRYSDHLHFEIETIVKR
ncbi:MAG: hypothetical protein QM703_02070 [Gemmatales bacterium]